jgi:uncharacterized repeat protein (TIGR03843 family)
VAGETATPTNGVLSHEQACALLEQAEIVGCQSLPWGSNYTFAVAFEAGDNRQVLGIYKPRRGEVPLWDFPDGTLYRRERAAYLASRHLGWEFIPPTVIRDGPYGVGSVQLYVDPEPRASYDRLRREYAEEIRRIAVFDCVANNADRKAGHFILGRGDNQIWGIDHGLTFNAAPKLRTVVWDYCGEPIPEPLIEDLCALRNDPPRWRAMFEELEPLLLPSELEALRRRLDALLDERCFPAPTSRRYMPWPPF